MSTSVKNTQLATITENDPRWASVVARYPQPPFDVLLFRQDDWCVLLCSAKNFVRGERVLR
jgi:hypothetical protein